MTESDAASRPDDPVSGLSFAHAARLQFDEILDQLVGRAREVQATQGRLRGLLRAYLAVARADNLDDVLRHIVEAARTLVDARYAALGVISQGGLARFIHTGMDDETARHVGRLPEGKGVLGLLVAHPEPLRLGNLADHLASVGFPDHHPPMTSFLGVPIRVADRVFGNLYLTDKQGADSFTTDDEELVLALAAAAGVAIENATLLAEGRRRQAWQTAMVQATTDLLGDIEPTAVLERFVRSASETLQAAGAAAAVPTDDPAVFRIAAADGAWADYLGAALTVADSVVADAVERDGPVVADRSRLPTGPPIGHDDVVGQTIAAAIHADAGLAGVLLVSRQTDGTPIDDLDRDIMAAFVTQTGLVLQLAEARRDGESLRRLQDREQIAEDLRNRAIQRLFSHGLALGALADRGRRDGLSERLQQQMEEVDAIIRDIRDTVLTLES